MMKKTLISVLVFSVFTASIASVSARVSLQNQPLLTEPQTEWTIEQEEDGGEALIGLGGGALLGALVGGPAGAVIGGITGTLIGQSVADTETVSVTLKNQQQHIAVQRQQVTSLTAKQLASEQRAAEYAATQKHLDALLAEQQQLLSELALGMNVPFRTGSSALEADFLPQLDNVATVMKRSSESNLELKGYADRRGDWRDNQSLSEHRLVEVRDYLIQQGVAPARMTTQSLGAAMSLNEQLDNESDVFDRHVTLTTQPTQGLMASRVTE